MPCGKRHRGRTWNGTSSPPSPRSRTQHPPWPAASDGARRGGGGGAAAAASPAQGHLRRTAFPQRTAAASRFVTPFDLSGSYFRGFGILLPGESPRHKQIYHYSRSHSIGLALCARAAPQKSIHTATVDVKESYTRLHVQHRALLAQLPERAAARSVALTVVPALVMALHLLYQLSLKINIFRHGTCLVARAIVATPGMAHLHLHHAGAELSIHRGRLPVMVPVVVVVVVLVLLLSLYWNICEHTTACNGPRPNPQPPDPNSFPPKTKTKS